MLFPHYYCSSRILLSENCTSVFKDLNKNQKCNVSEMDFMFVHFQSCCKVLNVHLLI